MKSRWKNVKIGQTPSLWCQNRKKYGKYYTFFYFERLPFIHNFQTSFQSWSISLMSSCNTNKVNKISNFSPPNLQLHLGGSPAEGFHNLAEFHCWDTSTSIPQTRHVNTSINNSQLMATCQKRKKFPGTLLVFLGKV